MTRNRWSLIYTKNRRQHGREGCMKESLKIRAIGNRQARDQGGQRVVCLEKRLYELSLVLQRCSGAVVAFNAKIGGSTTQLCT